MMWEAAAAKIKAQGGTIHMGTRLSGLEWDADAKTWTATAKTTTGEVMTFTANHVISSAPIRELLSCISPLPRSVDQARGLRYRDFITVALIVKKADLFSDNWIYIHDPSVQVGRIQNFRSWSPEKVPDPSLACLGLEYFCFEGDGLWTSSDADLIALASRELAQIGLVEETDVIDGCVVRQEKAYPVYDGDYRDRVEKVRADLAETCPTLHLVGRNGMHKYNNQDHAMMTAMLTVRNILAGDARYDVWNVNEDAEYHEAGGSSQIEALKSVRLVPERIPKDASART